MRILLFIVIASNAIAQQHTYHAPIRGSAVPLGMVGTYLGVEYSGNNQLNSWLGNNGSETRNEFRLSYGFMILVEQKNRYCIGLEGRGSYAKDPKSTNDNVSLLLGKRLTFKQLNIIPLIGIGLNRNDLTFSEGTIPFSLRNLGATSPNFNRKGIHD